MLKQKNILLAPLDWGLGHTTRCIPIIKTLLKEDITIFLAGNASQKTILNNEFPQLTFLDLAGYNISYGKNKFDLWYKLLTQMPELLKKINNEQQWLQKTIKKYDIHAVISDNRYGLYHTDIPTVLITHQLSIQAPSIIKSFIQKINYKYINRFTTCWIPDYEGKNNLGGVLSHPQKLPETPINYVGPLSRMLEMPISKKENLLLFILSGPEPQRTIFEHKILAQLPLKNFEAIIVRGLPNDNIELPKINHTTIYNYLPTTVLNQLMCEATFVISRTGYTTVMDIAATKSKSILIPTPGQTEQEYLAAHLEKQQMAITANQASFDLEKLVEKALLYEYQFPVIVNSDLLQAVINKWLQVI